MKTVCVFCKVELSYYN